MAPQQEKDHLVEAENLIYHIQHAWGLILEPTQHLLFIKDEVSNKCYRSHLYSELMRWYFENRPTTSSLHQSVGTIWFFSVPTQQEAVLVGTRWFLSVPTRQEAVLHIHAGFVWIWTRGDWSVKNAPQERLLPFVHISWSLHPLKECW
jgi:hypothetical protein